MISVLFPRFCSEFVKFVFLWYCISFLPKVMCDFYQNLQVKNFVLDLIDIGIFISRFCSYHWRKTNLLISIHEKYVKFLDNVFTVIYIDYIYNATLRLTPHKSYQILIGWVAKYPLPNICLILSNKN